MVSSHGAQNGSDNWVVEDLSRLIRELGLAVEAVIPTEDSRFVARVFDGERHLMLKAVGNRGADEIRVLHAWAIAGVGPRWFRQVGSDAYLCEWLEGDTLARTGPLSVETVGRQLRLLHSASIPPGLKSLAGRLSPKFVEQGWRGTLSDDWLRRAASLAQFLHDQLEHEPVCLLHGDVVPANIIVAGGQPALIDPVGYSGPAAWDLAQLSVAMVGTDRRENLALLVQGYGFRPPILDEFFRWMTFMFLDKNLGLEKQRPGSRQQVVDELSALADTL